MVMKISMSFRYGDGESGRFGGMDPTRPARGILAPRFHNCGKIRRF
jgi:hypothetical protein